MKFDIEATMLASPLGAIGIRVIRLLTRAKNARRDGLRRIELDSSIQYPVSRERIEKMSSPIGWLWAAAIFTLAGSPLAHAQSPKVGYMPANTQGCRVWVPAQLHSPDFIPQYVGGCKDGLASGKGHLDWLNRYASMRVSVAWEGYFADGVFVGTTPLETRIEPQPNATEYVVHLGSVPGGDVVIFPGNSRDGSMDLCGTYMLGVSLNASTPASDDAAVQQAMTDAGLKLAARCPTTPRTSVQVNAYAQPFTIDDHGQKTAAIAAANLNWTTHQLQGYSNQVSSEIRSRQRSADQAAKLADARQRFDEFSRRNGLSTWVTTSQLDSNPFKYSGKNVGVIVQLTRMVTRDTALVSGAVEGGGADVLLHGVDPNFPDRDHAVLLAVKVGEREPLPGDPDRRPALTALQRLDSAVCADPACSDWLGWARGAERISWGAPYP